MTYFALILSVPVILQALDTEFPRRRNEILFITMPLLLLFQALGIWARREGVRLGWRGRWDFSPIPYSPVRRRTLTGELLWLTASICCLLGSFLLLSVLETGSYVLHLRTFTEDRGQATIWNAPGSGITGVAWRIAGTTRTAKEHFTDALSPGTIWELAEAFRLLTPQRLLLVISALEDTEYERIHNGLNSIGSDPGSSRLPDYQSLTSSGEEPIRTAHGFIHFNADWTPVATRIPWPIDNALGSPFGAFIRGLGAAFTQLDEYERETKTPCG